jgi:hypothetical protein
MLKFFLTSSFLVFQTGCDVTQFLPDAQSETPTQSSLSKEKASTPEETKDTEANAKTNEDFAQDGDSFELAVGDTVSFKLEHPEGVTTNTAIWLPEEGGFGPHLSIQRSYRSLVDGVFFTEHIFRGAEAGDVTFVFANKDMGKITSDERVTLSFRITE